MSTTETPIIFYKPGQKINPRAAKGRFNNLRVLFVILTQCLFYLLPWAQWNGRQAFLLDLTHRKFYLFDWVFWPQDILIVALLLMVAAYSLFLFTTIAGRLFCGYVCPQTVYTELFLWIETWIEGNRTRRIALDKAPFGLQKLRIKTIKHVLWIVLAAWTGFTFVGYFSPILDLGARVFTLNLGGWETFWILFYSFATWGNAGFMREKICLHMCPYARFQSVMFDQDTFIVSYDKERGEPRGHRSSKQAHSTLKDDHKGDCVDCSMCVQVCPTGIDIRNGLQYECIGCGACIDACDEVMEKMKYPKGLIRYTSERALAEGKTLANSLHRLLRPRVIGYSIMWIIIVIAFVIFLSVRSPLKVDVLRDRSLYTENVDGSIDNNYQIQVINTKEQSVRIQLSAEGLQGISVIAPTTFEIEALQNKIIPVTLRYQPKPVDDQGKNDEHRGLEARSAHINLIVTDKVNNISVTEKTRFLIPE